MVSSSCFTRLVHQVFVADSDIHVVFREPAARTETYQNPPLAVENPIFLQ